MSNFSMNLLSDEFAVLYTDDNTHFPPQWAIPNEYRTARDRVGDNGLGEVLTDPETPGEEEEDDFDNAVKTDGQDEYFKVTAEEVFKEDGDVNGNGLGSNNSPDTAQKNLQVIEKRRHEDSQISYPYPLHWQGNPSLATIPEEDTKQASEAQAAALLSAPLFPPPAAENGEEHPLSLIVIPGVEVVDAAATANPKKGVRQFTCAQWKDADVRRTPGQGNERANAERDLPARLRELLRAPPLLDEGNTPSSSPAPKLVGCFYFNDLNDAAAAAAAAAAATRASVVSGSVSPPGFEWSRGRIGGSGRFSVLGVEESGNGFYANSASAAPTTDEIMGRNLSALATIREEMEVISMTGDPGAAEYAPLLDVCNSVALPPSYRGMGGGGSSSPFLPLPMPSGASSPNSSLLSPSPPPLQFSEPPNKMSLYSKFGKIGDSPGSFNSPHGFCSGMMEEVIVADTGNHRIQVYAQLLSYVQGSVMTVHCDIEFSTKQFWISKCRHRLQQVCFSMPVNRVNV